MLLNFDLTQRLEVTVVVNKIDWVDVVVAGKPCADTPNMRINGQKCSSLLGSSSNKRRYCDNPTIIKHCCATRDRNCAGYHWITPSKL